MTFHLSIVRRKVRSRDTLCVSSARSTTFKVMDSGSPDEIEERVRTWNDLLKAQAAEFSTSSKEATLFLFSSCQVVTEVLEDPAEFDFGEDDPTTEGGGIWQDDLHLTSDMHSVLAEKLFASLFPPS